MAKHFVSLSCGGEKCQFIDPLADFVPVPTPPDYVPRCGRPATHKVGEEIAHDDPNPCRHNLTAYVCCRHFRLIVGGTCE